MLQWASWRGGVVTLSKIRKWYKFGQKGRIKCKREMENQNYQKGEEVPLINMGDIRRRVM